MNITTIDYELNEAIQSAEDAYDDEFTKLMISKFPRFQNQKTLQQDLLDFEIIWNNYNNIVPCNESELYNYMKIITKIRSNDFNFVEDKNVFINLIQIMSITIYNSKKMNEIFNEQFNENKEYSDVELNCCYYLKKYLMKI